MSDRDYIKELGKVIANALSWLFTQLVFAVVFLVTWRKKKS